jgi:hypothetical protein
MPGPGSHGWAACYSSGTRMFGLFYPWGMILQAVAIVHFMRRRPDGYWLWIILMLGGLGALAYIVAEVLPDVGLLRGSLRAFPRRRRIRELEVAIVDNPSVGNLEELADLNLEEGKFAQARELYNRVLARPSDAIDPYYRRGLAAIEMGDFTAAVPDLERVVAKDPKYDFHRAIGLLAHALGQTGQADRARMLFDQATGISTLSETYYNYATFLAAQNDADGARTWAQRILAKKPSMPRYLQRLERPWFRKAKALIKKLPQAS